MSWRLDRVEPVDGSPAIQLPTTNASWDAGTGAPVRATIDLPGGGAWDSWGDQIAQPGATTYPLKAEMWAARNETPAQLQTRIRALYTLRGKKVKLYRRWPDGTMEWTYARCQQVKSPMDNSNVLIVPIEMSFETVSPVWNGAQHSPNWQFDGSVSWGDGHTFDANNVYALNSSVTTLTLHNGGTLPVRDIRLLFTATNEGGQVLKIQVAATATKCEWQYTGNLTDGSVLVDCGQPAVYLGVIPDYRNFRRTANHNNDYWLELLPGDNLVTVTYSAISTTLNLQIDYYDAVE